jgi:hypothetical protein
MAWVVELTKEPTIATSSQPAFFNTISLEYTLIEKHIAAKTRKTTLMMITISPSGFELDILTTLQVLGEIWVT